MLRNTLILPVESPELAGRLLRDAVADLDVVLMLVFGTGASVEQVVTWADQLANKTQLPGGGNLRRVVWLRNGDALAGLDGLRPLFADLKQEGEGQLPLAAVLDFHDQVKGAIVAGQPTDPIKLELLFLKGHQV
jgi:hypothetical protein